MTHKLDHPVALDEGPLTDRDRHLLDFAGRFYKLRGLQEDAIRKELDMSPTAFWQIVNQLARTAPAQAYAPTTCKRLLRIADPKSA